MAEVIRREKNRKKSATSHSPRPCLCRSWSGGQTERCQLQEPSVQLERKLIVYPYITFTACLLFDVMRRPSAPLYTGSDLGDPMVLPGIHITDIVSARRVMCTVSMSGSSSSLLSDERSTGLSASHYDCSRCLSLVQALSTTLLNRKVNFFSYLCIITFFKSDISFFNQ